MLVFREFNYALSVFYNVILKIKKNYTLYNEKKNHSLEYC